MAINPDSHTPIFMQIVEHIRTGIAAGIHRPDEMLPSLRGLALKWLVNPNTVQRAFEQLEREGLVYSRKGVGLFVDKQGVKAARNHAQGLVAQAFAEAVAAARAANISDDQIRAIFARAFAGRTQTGGKP